MNLNKSFPTKKIPGPDALIINFIKIFRESYTNFLKELVNNEPFPIHVEASITYQNLTSALKKVQTKIPRDHRCKTS